MKTDSKDGRAISRILADTSAAWDALKLKSEPSRVARDQHRLEDAKAFWELLEEPYVEMYYTSLLENNLSLHFRAPWEELRGNLIRAAIPLSKADGYHKANGSLLCGGVYGGMRRVLLSSNHELKLQNAAKVHHESGQDIEYRKQRRKEFDYEHLEAALELDATCFITTDYALLRRLRTLTAEQRKNPHVHKAASIAVRPVHALGFIRAR